MILNVCIFLMKYWYVRIDSRIALLEARFKDFFSYYFWI